jgi:hypothetical protein
MDTAYIADGIISCSYFSAHAGVSSTIGSMLISGSTSASCSYDFLTIMLVNLTIRNMYIAEKIIRIAAIILPIYDSFMYLFDQNKTRSDGYMAKKIALASILDGWFT